MPAPNLGLVGAYGGAGLQQEIQKMVAERREQEQLEYERAMKEREWAAKQAAEQRETEELGRHRKALEDYQAGDLEVRRAAATQPKPASRIQLKAYDPKRGVMQTVFYDEDKMQELGRIDTPEAPPKTTRSLQSETILVNGQKQLAGFDPTTAQYVDQRGNVIPNAQPVPKEVDPMLEELRQQRILLNNQLLNQGLPQNVQKRVDEKRSRFENDPTVKNFGKIGEAMTFVESLPQDTDNPQMDQGLIYAFAKAMDPDSAVREGEYATVQKYAQSWLQQFGFDALRIVQNTAFLTPEARANIKAAVRAKFEANHRSYQNIRTQYGRQIDQDTGRPGTGTDYLIDYAAGFAVTPGGAGGGKFQATDPDGKVRTFSSQAAMERAMKGWADYEARTKPKKGGR